MWSHGDPIISGAIEDKPDSYTGPRCGYTVREKVNGVETVKTCGSPKVDWNVTGRGVWGTEKKTPVCNEHLEKAWKEWGRIQSAERIQK